ncbi:hypothetical protein KR009_000637 [Drosophila setifemur]|nr:hypothetical protein KR009_000637 [Drosophila setifemur]
MDPQKITELANLLRQNGDKILSSEFTLTLSGSLLRALNDSFTLIADNENTFGPGSHAQHHTFQVVKPINAKSSVFPDLQLLHDFVQKATLLKLAFFPGEIGFECRIDISKFRALRRLEVHKISISQVIGIQPLRGQLQHLICVKSLASVDDIIARCGGDNSNGFVWNELHSADFSYNSLHRVDTALEFAQNLQHLSLRHNKLTSVEAIKWLPHLKTLDLSYNCLTHLPQFHMEACRQLQLLNISNNYVEELLDVAKLDALSNLDLCDNCLLEHSQLLPLSALVTLTTLNLQGNPLACYPKHRQATAQYLHSNTSVVKFILDFKPLSKTEKALTGSQKWRFIGSCLPRSSSVSINSSSVSISNSDGSQFSSFGSHRSVSIRGQDYYYGMEQTVGMETSQTNKKLTLKKSCSRIRTVDIQEHSEDVAAFQPETKVITDSSHLETKKQVEALRLTYGDKWLKSGNAEQMLGIEPSQSSEQQRNKAREHYNEFLGDFSEFSKTRLVQSKTDPFNTDCYKPGKPLTSDTLKACIESCDEGVVSQNESITNSSQEQLAKKQTIDKLLNLYTISTNTSQEKDPVSDAEPDEETYIVYLEKKQSEALLLTISSNFIREKDTLTERTKTKWCLKILESCERVKSNSLRIHFDTMRKDKQERIYCVENTLCQELEKKLRNILSQRDLTEMNISIYRCVNCMSQFTIEHKNKQFKTEGVRCPDCRSVYVAEVLSSSLDEPSVEAMAEPKVSPAFVVEESALEKFNFNFTMFFVPFLSFNKINVLYKIYDNTLVTNCRLTTARSTPMCRTLMLTTKSSANSLNESSSCSKLTNSQSSFDSNQSVVGSSNTDRDLEFRANESDVDIISNPSQSSIEVLDANSVQSASLRASERCVSQPTDLKPMSDDDDFIEREFGPLFNKKPKLTAPSTTTAALATSTISQVQLTESSSSGSVTDSICTSYEQQSNEKPQTLPNLKTSSQNDEQLKKVEEVGLISFESVYQSTNLLMSKKLIESEDKACTSHPYKFNYRDFNDIDHRLKLFFYQKKFKEEGEHFHWLAKGRIFNEQTQALGEGILVISTRRCYLMEAFAAPHDDVTKWLRQVVSVTVDRLVAIKLMPWKLGLSFSLKGWGGFVLLMLDMLRTDSLLLYLKDYPLPVHCEISPHPSPTLINQLQVIFPEPVTMCTMLPRCQWTCEDKNQSFEPCLLLITNSYLYVSGSDKFSWLSTKNREKIPEPSLSQHMSNLVDMKRITDQEYMIKFIDETQNKCETWKICFETLASARCCLNAVGQGWEQLFGVPLSFSGTYLKVF